jgi:hypothetical protein
MACAAIDLGLQAGVPEGTDGSVGVGSAEAPDSGVRREPFECGVLGAACGDSSHDDDGGVDGDGRCAGAYCLPGAGICIPTLRDTIACSDSSCDPQAPVCMKLEGLKAASCVTHDELSCICATETGRAQVTDCSCNREAGRSCGSGDEPCCSGMACVGGSDPGTAGCRPVCETHLNCDTGCCISTSNTGLSICVDESYCRCTSIPGERCGGELDRCCTGFICIKSPSSDFSGCRPECTRDDECDTGCCQLLSGNRGGFCVDARYCECVRIGGRCGGGLTCCKGTRCSRFDSEKEFTCLQQCTENKQCDSGLCGLFPSESRGVCFTPDSESE